MFVSDSKIKTAAYVATNCIMEGLLFYCYTNLYTADSDHEKIVFKTHATGTALLTLMHSTRYFTERKVKSILGDAPGSAFYVLTGLAVSVFDWGKMCLEIPFEKSCARLLNLKMSVAALAMFGVGAPLLEEQIYEFILSHSKEEYAVFRNASNEDKLAKRKPLCNALVEKYMRDEKVTLAVDIADKFEGKIREEFYEKILFLWKLRVNVYSNGNCNAKKFKELTHEAFLIIQGLEKPLKRIEEYVNFIKSFSPKEEYQPSVEKVWDKAKSDVFNCDDPFDQVKGLCLIVEAYLFENRCIEAISTFNEAKVIFNSIQSRNSSQIEETGERLNGLESFLKNSMAL